MIPYRDGVPGVVPLGPRSWSTDTTLTTRDLVICWDVNRYYRDLGLEWPYRQTTTQIRRVFMEGNGHADARKVHCFTRLIDPNIRAEYDALPLGEVMEDHYTYIERRRASVGSTEGVDNPEPEVQDEEHSAAKEHLDSSEDDYLYSVYLWKTELFDRKALHRWQSLILEAAREQGRNFQVSLGVMEQEPSSWMVGSVGTNAPLVLVDRYAQPTMMEARRIVENLR